MEKLNRKESRALKDLIKMEIDGTRMAIKEAPEEDKEELRDYLSTLRSLRDKIFKKEEK